MDIVFKTDKGVTRSNNEDACFVMMKEKVFIIADGVGGNKSGEIASRTATRLISQYVSSNKLPDIKEGERALKNYFDECIKITNTKIIELGNKFNENFGMATTLVIAIVRDKSLYVFNIGDSRAYIYREKKLRKITEDHTYVNTLVKAGIITEEEAELHEDKNAITKALGADEMVEADFFREDIIENDVFILCTDGLYAEVSPEEIKRELNKGLSMSDTCTNLVNLANLNGGGDNITLVCIKIVKEDSYE